MPEEPIFGPASEYLQSVWNQVGIAVKLQDVEYAAWASALVNGTFDAMPLKDLQHQSSYRRFHCVHLRAAPAGLNFGRTKDSQVEDEIKAAEASSGAVGCLHWSNVQSLMLQHFDLLPLATPKTQYFSRGIANQPTQTSIKFIALRRVA